MSTPMMRAQIAAAEEYRTLLHNPQFIIEDIEKSITELSKYVPELLCKKYEDFGLKRERLEESEIEELLSMERFLAEQLYCFQNNLTNHFERDLFLKKGGVVEIPCRYN